MKNLYLASLLLLSNLIESQSTCNNLDFEDLNYSGWILSAGTAPNSFGPPQNVVPYTGASTTGLDAPNALHALVTNTASFQGVSLISGLPGNVVARINHMTGSNTVSILERMLNVSATQPTINFSYLMFSQIAAHPAYGDSNFQFVVLDPNGDEIPGTYTYIDQTLTPGFSVTPSSSFWNYKPWTPVSLDLTPYIGQTVKLQLFGSDCSAGGHTGFVYVDFDCAGNAVGVKEDFQTALSIGPNPVINELNYRLPHSAVGSYTIFACDGRLVSKGEFDSPEGTINTADLTAGVYTMQFNFSNGGNLIKKFLKSPSN